MMLTNSAKIAYHVRTEDCNLAQKHKQGKPSSEKYETLL